MNETKNYKLNQWSAEDRVLRTDFNADNTKIEGALSGLNTSIGSLNSSVSTINTNLSKKASTTSLNSAVSRISSLESGKVDKTAHSSDVSALRSENCWVKLGSSYITTEGGKPSVSISSISQYLELRVALQALNNADGTGKLYLAFNGGEPLLSYSGNGNDQKLSKNAVLNGASGPSCHASGLLTLFPVWKGGVHVIARYAALCKRIQTSANPGWLYARLNLNFPTTDWTDIKSLELVGELPLVAGSGFTVYGLKK